MLLLHIEVSQEKEGYFLENKPSENSENREF